MTILKPLLVPYVVGSTIGALILTAIAYPVALAFVTSRRRIMTSSPTINIEGFAQNCGVAAILPSSNIMIISGSFWRKSVVTAVAVAASCRCTK